MKSSASTPQAYIDELSPDRKSALSAVRALILSRLPEGYEETMAWGLICYVVPLSTYSDTYNKQPLMYAALGSQKNYMAVYLTNVYNNPDTLKWFESEYKNSGKKLNMGKSCVRFTKLDDLPLDLIGKVIAKTPVTEFIAIHEKYYSARKNMRG